MKHGCRVRIRESGKERGRERERENRCIFEEFSIHDTIRGIMRSWKNRKFVTMVRPRYSEGSQSRNVASIFEILGNFHIVESHEADSIQFLFALYLHPSIGCSTFSRYLFSPLFWGEKDRLDPTRFRVIAPLRETPRGKWIILNRQLFLNFITLSEESIYLVEYLYSSPPLSQKFSREFAEIVETQRILKF